MEALSTLLRALGVFVATVIFQALSEIVIPIKGPSIPHFAEWAMLSTAVVTAALAVLALRSDWRGWKLGAAVALIPIAIAAVNFLEGIVFLTNTNLPWGRIFSSTLLSYALTIPVWALLFGRREKIPQHYHPLESKSAGERAWKFALSDLSYLFLYYAAGMIIFPYVKDFYATQHLPSTGSLVALQLLIRGPVFVLLCLAISRMLGLSRITGALTAGAIFTLLSGVAPLLIPSPVFPDSVRWVHFAEVTSSNFVFGAIVGWLWGQPKPSHSPALAQTA